MGPKDLLAPRYKCIADYPNQEFEKGEILYSDGGKFYYCSDIGRHSISPDYYPAIFQKLEWWENRDVDDMPKYVKRLDDGAIIKTDKWFLVGGDMRWHTENKFVTMSAKTCLPATKEEYNTYLIQQKTKS